MPIIIQTGVAGNSVVTFCKKKTTGAGATVVWAEEA